METAPAWSPDFFSGLVVESWRQVSAHFPTQAEADFLVQALAPQPGARIADVPCGNGRLTLELAARGFAVTGVDLTVTFLDDARRAAREKNLPARFEQHDMRELPWREEFDHAFCFGNSFAYFDHAGNLAFLRAIHQILKPGGTFALETRFCAEALFPQPLGRRWYPLEDLLFLHDAQYYPATGQLVSQYTLLLNGQTEKKQAVYQTYTYRELVQMLREAGFVQVEGFGSLKREPFRLGSEGLWLVAERAK